MHKKIKTTSNGIRHFTNISTWNRNKFNLPFLSFLLFYYFIEVQTKITHTLPEKLKDKKTNVIKKLAVSNSL